MPEYERGAGEQVNNEENETMNKKEVDTTAKSSVMKDVCYLLVNKTYVLVCLAFACTSGVTEIGMAFVSELLRKQFILVDQQQICIQDFTIKNDTMKALFIANNDTCQSYITNNLVVDNTIKNYTADQFTCDSCAATASGISMTLGGVSVLGGIGGTLTGMVLYNSFYEKSKRTSGCLASGIGCLLCGIAVLVLSTNSENINRLFSWGIAVAMFFTISINFGVLTDVNNRVIAPTKRSLSNAGQNFIGRLLGGTIPPYLAGKLIDNSIKNNIVTIQSESNVIKQLSEFLWMQYDATMKGVMLCSYFAFASGCLWLAAALFWAKDEDAKKKDSGD